MTRRSASASDLRWTGFGDRRPAREQLAAAVRELTHGRRDQMLMAAAWAALLWGTVAATAWVLAARLFLGVTNPWPGVGVVLAGALAVAAGTAWLRRPDDMQVAIRADLDLGLDQALSTAWELERRGADEALLERLAHQAVGSYRLPRRAGEVYRPEATRETRLLPLALVALLLAAVVDLPRGAPPAPAAVDPVVAEEGRRLRDFAVEMQQRALRDALPRSATGAETLSQLGTRMHAGELSRGEALVRLREAGAEMRLQGRLAAAEDVQMAGAEALGARTGDGPLLEGARLRELLERLLAGTTGAAERRALGDEAMTMSASGVDLEQLREALRRLAEGDASELREIVEQLERAERAAREMRELELAEERLRLARENLGESDDEEPRRRVARMDDGPRGAAGEEQMLVLDPRRTGRDAEGGAAVSLGIPAHGRGGLADELQRGGRGATSAQDDDQVVLKPESRPGTGPVRRTEARALPRTGTPTLETRDVDRRFTAQVEAVLSQEEIPLHEKELVRRYFLELGTQPGTSR